MKKIFSAIFILCSTIVFSQINISGLITDSLNTPVPFAPIGLLSISDSTMVKGTMTDETGRYSMEGISTGKYQLQVVASGYQKKVIENITVDSTSKDLLRNIILSSSSYGLSEITVTAAKKIVEFKNGNITVNVEDSPLAKGNSVFDLLKKLPGVSVDGNKIMIQGKAGAIVMIDNRPQLLAGDQLINLLKSMNADLVSTIEVLKNPPVKYDASGTSGMINIKSKKTTISGLTGTVFSSYSQGFYEQMMSGFSLSYKSKKIVFYSNLSGDYGHYRMREKFEKKFVSDTTSMELNTKNISKTFESTLNYKAGIDWLATNVDIFGIKVEGGPGQNKVNIDGKNSVLGNNDLGFDHLNAAVVQPSNWNINNFNFNYDHKIDTIGSSFSLVSDYTILSEDASSTNMNEFYDVNGNRIFQANNYRSNNKGNSDVFSGRADLMKVIDTTSSIEAGIKTAYSQTLNDYLFERDLLANNIYSKDLNLSNRFQYTEITYAGYFNYSKTIRKLSMKLGVRLEKTDLTGRNFEKDFKLNRKYFNVFPNLSFDYKKNDDHDFQLNLSRRIDRPLFYDLNPFMVFRDQYSFYQGNPFLLPNYANKGEFSYVYKEAFATSIAYSYIENVMLGYTSQNDSTKVTMESTKNMKSSNSIEYSVFYQKSLLNKWQLTVSGVVANVNYKGAVDGMNFNRSGITYYGELLNSILVGKNAKFEINGTYWGPNIFGITRSKARWMASVAVNFSLLKERLDLTLGVDDIFYSFIGASRTNFENQNWTYQQINDSRRFRIALNYKFGKIKIEDRPVNPSNEGERERLKH